MTENYSTATAVMINSGLRISALSLLVEDYHAAYCRGDASLLDASLLVRRSIFSLALWEEVAAADCRRVRVLG